MEKTANVAATLFQFIAAFVILFIIFLVYAVLEVEEADTVNAIGFFLFQPFMASVFSALTVALCFTVGLPIPFNSKVNRWWRSKPLMPVTGLAPASFFCCLLSLPA